MNQLVLGAPSPVLEVAKHKEFKLYPDQHNCKRELYARIKEGYFRILLLAACGAGKTAIAAQIMFDAAFKAKTPLRCVFLVDQDNLVKQTIAHFHEKRSVKIGRLQRKSSPAPTDTLFVASLQTIQARLRRGFSISEILGEDLGLVILDEAHDTAYNSAYAEIEACYRDRGTIFIGLTATPYRLSPDQWLGQWYNVTVEAPQPPELIKMGRAVPCFGYKGGDIFDPSKLDTVGGDWRDDQMSDQASQKASLSCVVGKYIEMCQGRPFAAFCPTVEHSKKLAAAFCEAGIPTEHQDGNTKDSVRDDQKTRIESGVLQGLTSVGTMTKGFDCPVISAILYVRMTKSKAGFMQAAGRGGRPFPRSGKQDYILLDFGGNLKRFGSPTGCQDYDISAKDGKPKDEFKEEHLKYCPDCGFAQSVFAAACQACGHIFNPKGEEEEVEQEADDFEMTLYVDKEETAKAKFLREQKRLCFSEDLSPNVAIARFKSRYGYIPPNEFHLAAVLGTRYSEKKKREFEEYLQRHKVSDIFYRLNMGLEFGFKNKVKKARRG